MRKIVLALLAIAFAGLCIAQKSKYSKSNISSQAPDLPACCIEHTDMPGPKTVDAAFMEIAATQQFGSLHLEPLPFELEDPKGAMTMFTCTDGQPGNGYLIPAQAKSNNWLIVIQEWWGLNDHIKQEADKFYTALDGKVNVLAVDLYDGKVAATVDSAQKLIRAALGSKRKETILQGALSFAGDNANVYSVGWCFGGMMSLQTAIMGGSKMKGCIMYYGTPEKDETRIAQINCDVLGIFGTQDRSIPNETVDKFAQQMKAAGKTFILERYDAPHAFANPSNPGYNKQYGDDAFGKSVAFLKARIKG